MLVDRKASCHVANAFLTRLKLIWLPPISNLKISKKLHFFSKSSRSQWVNKPKYIVQIMKCKLQMKTNKNEEAFGGFEFEFGLAEIKIHLMI